MAKKTYKVKCDSSNSNLNASAVRFIIEGEPVATQPGQPAQRTAKTIIQIAFARDNKAAKDFEPGKSYTVTIEG